MTDGSGITNILQILAQVIDLGVGDAALITMALCGLAASGWGVRVARSVASRPL